MTQFLYRSGRESWRAPISVSDFGLKLTPSIQSVASPLRIKKLTPGIAKALHIIK